MVAAIHHDDKPDQTLPRISSEQPWDGGALRHSNKNYHPTTKQTMPVAYHHHTYPHPYHPLMQLEPYPVQFPTVLRYSRGRYSDHPNHRLRGNVGGMYSLDVRVKLHPLQMMLVLLLQILLHREQGRRRVFFYNGWQPPC